MSWPQLKLWLKDHANAIYKDLNAEADQRTIMELEENIGVLLPKSFKNYLQSNNGQFGTTGPVLMQDWELMNIKFIIKTWQMHNDIYDEENNYKREDQSQKTVPYWRDSKWVPFANNGAGDYLCLDLNPGPKGVVGQIIIFWHTNSIRQVIARDWDQLLDQFLKDLKEEKYAYIDNNKLIKK